jgi:hypothetical protein
MGFGVVVKRQPQLFQIVLALRTPGGFAGLLDGRQQQRNQHGDDGDDHQQFDESESLSHGHAWTPQKRTGANGGDKPTINNDPENRRSKFVE